MLGQHDARQQADAAAATSTFGSVATKATTLPPVPALSTSMAASMAPPKQESSTLLSANMRGICSSAASTCATQAPQAETSTAGSAPCAAC